MENQNGSTGIVENQETMVVNVSTESISNQPTTMEIHALPTVSDQQLSENSNVKETEMEFFSITTRGIQRNQMRKAIKEKVKEYESSMRQMKNYLRSIGVKPTLNNMYRELIENVVKE